MTTTNYRAELDEILKRFGANMRRLRVADGRGVSQEELASITNLHRTEIGRLEQGRAEPRLSTLLILAEGLGVTIEELLAGLDTPTERRPAPSTRRLR